MSVRLLLDAPEAAHLPLTAAGYVLGTGRTVPTAAAVVGLASVVLGGLALVRSVRRAGISGGRVGAGAAVVLGLAGAAVGGLHAVSSAGGLGTGNGLAGAVVAVVLGAAGVVVGGLGLVRSRRRPRTGRPGEQVRP